MTSSDKIAHNSWLPQITFSDKVSTPLEISSHKLSVQVAAPLALVTSVLTFVNKHNRTLQGELVFPLPDDATVTGYALDVNGTMVDAVPIEKEKAKVVFEEAVRSGKGASVVEMAAQSNSFKTSIYPLHANQSRTIKVVYNMPVGTVDNQSQITLPFGTPAESVHVSANIEWKNSDKVHVQLVKGDKREDSTTQIDLKDTSVEALVISSENTLKDNQVTVEGNYFCARIKVEQPKEKEVTQPNNVQILYDVSYSRREQHAKDTKLLTTVLNKLNPKQITLTTFSVDPRPAISCASVSDFLKQFEKVVFDGATNLENVEQSLDENADYCILLTDGLHTIGDDVNPESVYSIPMYIVTTTKSSNQHLLSHMATKSGGAYLNANTMSNEQIAAKIGTPVLFFLVADYEPDQFEEVYPNEPVTLETGGFLHLYGKIKNSGGEIVVSFKYGREICETREIQIGAAQTIESPKEKIIPKLWAKQKLASLSAFPKLFANEMKELALDWKIVTANTSLIVLEEVSQYLKHDITPPETLDYVYKAYMVQKKDRQRSAEQEKQDKIRSVLSKWNERKQWHKTDFKSAIDQKRKEEEERKKQEEERRKQEEERRIQQSTTQRSLDSARETVSNNIDNLLQRGETLDGLQMRSEELSMSTSSFMRREAPMSRSRASPAPQSLLSAPRSSRKNSQAPQEEISILADEPSSDFANCEEQGEFYEDEDEEGGCSSDDEGVEKKESTSSSSTSASIQVQKWSSDQPYMTPIKSATDKYQKYLEVRKEYATSPAFFLDIADYFLSDLKQGEHGLNILTNILELELESEQLYRIVAYRLYQEKRFELAEMLFDKVKSMRPDQPQSYRDLALTKEQLGKLEEAADLFNQVIYKQWDSRFDEIELTAAIELNHVLAKNPKLPICDEGFRHHMDLDLRISMAWDSDNTDVDLHVNETCYSGQNAYFGNRRTPIGGFVSRDFREGFGPEEYMLKAAQPGEYKISCNYYSSQQQTLTGGTTILLTFFTNYMRQDEKSEMVTVRLVTTASQLPVCTVTV